MRELHLFAGLGGGILGGLLLGHLPVCAVELDPYCRRVLHERQTDGFLPAFPIHDDIRSFDARPWRGRVDVVCGGFPCQPWSSAGKQRGTDDPRHLWPEMARVVAECRPAFVFAENVSLAAFEEPWRDLRGLGYRVPPALCLAAADCGAPHLRKRWWLLAGDADRSDEPTQREVREQIAEPCRDRLSDPDGDPLRNEPVAEQGCDGAPLAAEHGGEPAMADTNGEPRRQEARAAEPRTGSQATLGRSTEPGRCRRSGSDPDRRRREEQRQSQLAQLESARGRFADGFREARRQQHPEAIAARVRDARGARLALRKGPKGQRAYATATRAGWWATEPDVGRVAHGIPARVDRLRGLGNAQVPLCAAEAFVELMAQLRAEVSA